MHGLMMNYPLTLTHILERSAKLFPAKELASKTPEGMHRHSYADFHARAHAVAQGLKRLGVKLGDRIGTLCWNSSRHLELYFAIPCYGAVLHTLNLRLPSDQLAYIINHAEDQVIFVDASLASILEPMRDQIPWMKIRPRRPVIRREQQEIPRACFIRIARCSCTASHWR